MKVAECFEPWTYLRDFISSGASQTIEVGPDVISVRKP